MQLSVEHVHEDVPVPVTVIALEGELDGSNYQELIGKARDLYAAGSRNILIDMSQLRFLSSAGLLSLHQIALLLRGQPLPSSEPGWSAFREMANERDAAMGKEKHLKLLNPPPRIAMNLQISGMDGMFEIFSEREAALAAFAD